ncbi:DUF4124 domain-containing protein [Luteibacter sp. 3190]|uniref:DUF4124 domain-containing protein n=1 Tax=Luteibacter sp. 3190 TaxID=2817736 RepID=UPI002854E1BF|nr:DUF4124 domain-containing protein [Luteibacter sp. 3190]MDR6936459.1 hypothetical protein [Luteibacter sp. 3190]
MRHVIHGLALGLVGFACAASAQNAYKWTDAQGVTHYSDQPPPAGRAANTIRLQGSSEPRTDGSPSAVATSPSKAQAQALDEADAAARARNCERARQNLTTLASGAMLVDSTDPATAKRLQDFEVEDAKRRAQGEVSTYCGTAAR